MGLGVLDTKESNVPGTAVLTDNDPLAGLRAYGENLDLSKLKYATGKNSHIVLVPQPSDDPNDPLNWSYAKRWSCFMALAFSVTLTGVAGPLLSAATLVIQADFNITLAEAGQATAGWQIFGVAVSMPFWGPIMMKFGRRLPFLLGGILMAVGGIVSATAQTHTALVAGRAILGIGMGPAECLAGALVGDLFYVHERGLPVALYNLVFVSGISLSPSVSGLVTARHGWRTASWIFAAFAIVAVVCQFFFQYETLYIRKITHLTKVDGVVTSAEDEKGGQAAVRPVSTVPQRSYVQMLKPWSGVYPTSASFFQMVYRPFLLMLSPITLWAFLGYGVPITFIVLVAVSASFLFSGPPYNFGPEQSGYVWFASLVGTLLASLIAGRLSDSLSKALARRNHGIFEPEFRLPLIAMLTFVGGFGYLGWGLGLQNKDPWAAPVISFGMIGFGMTFGLTISSAYLIDAFGDASASALTSMMTIKNFVSFSATYWAAPWVTTYSLVSVFGTIAGIHFAIGVLTIPMYIWGKRARLITSKHIHFRDDAAIAH